MENHSGKKKSFRFLWYDLAFTVRKSSVGFSNTRWSRLALWGILFFSCFHVYEERSLDNSWRQTLGSDGIGYYAYLPATFIYHDFSYSFLPKLSKKYKDISVASQLGFCNSFNGKNVNKYFVGEAVALSPFFLVANSISGSDENPHDGYSFYYMMAVSIAAIFYLLLGLWAIREFLLRFGIREGHIALVLLSIFFATNLFRYAMGEEAMSHIYSFAFISCFVLQAHRLFEKFTAKGFFMLAFLFSFIVLIRPVNGMVLLSLPFLAGNISNLKLFFTEIFRRPVFVIGGLAIFCAVIFIQLAMYHQQCGKWLVYAYDQEGFHFLRPHFFSCLFSYTNGAFVYSPLLLICLLGIFTFFRNDKFRFFSFAVFFCVVVWVISSWWAWTYGGAFGMRPLVEYYSFFALLLGLLIKNISGKRFAVFCFTVVLLFPLSALCQLQIWQYKMGIIGYDEMTKEKYWFVFLETRRQFHYINIEGPPAPISANAKHIYSAVDNFETQDPGEDWRSVTTEKAFSGTHSVCLKNENNHAPHWKRRLGDILPDSIITSGKLNVAINSKWLLEDNGSDARLVMFLTRKDSMIYYIDTYIIHQVREKNKWTDFNCDIDLPKVMPDDTIEIFPRRDNWFPIYMDDLKVNFYKK